MGCRRQRGAHLCQREVVGQGGAGLRQELHVHKVAAPLLRQIHQLADVVLWCDHVHPAQLQNSGLSEQCPSDPVGMSAFPTGSIFPLCSNCCCWTAPPQTWQSVCRLNGRA